MASALNCLALGLPGGYEWIIIAIIGLLLFGKRLPEVGKSLGKGSVEFKKGLKGIEDDIDTSVDRQKEMLPPPENRSSESGVHTGAEQHVPRQ